MKDFDAERLAKRKVEEERSFKLGGELFLTKSGVHPDVLAGWDSIDEKTGVGDTLVIVDDLVKEFLDDDDARARYDAVRAVRDGDEVVTIEDLLELVKWLLEAETGRPTGPPSASGSGRDSTATRSTGDSSLQGIPEALAAA